MKDLLEISCGLDVPKKRFVACILTGPLGKPTHSEIREILYPDSGYDFPAGLDRFSKLSSCRYGKHGHLLDAYL